MKRFVAAAILTLATVSSTGAEEIPIRLAQRHFVVVPVRINDRGPYEFLLDTGSTTSVVDRKLADELGLRSLGETVIRTVTGKETAPIVRIDAIALGSRTARTVLALSSHLRGIRALDGGIRGVLGFNFLSRFNYLLDYGGGRIIVGDFAHIEGPRLRFDASARSIVLTMDGSRWLLDTGATGVTLLGRRGADVQVQARAPLRVSTNDGFRLARAGWIRRLHVGDTTFHELPVTVAEDTGLEDRADGLLPGTLFDSIYFDHERESVVVNPTVWVTAPVGEPGVTTAATR